MTQPNAGGKVLDLMEALKDSLTKSDESAKDAHERALQDQSLIGLVAELVLLDSRIASITEVLDAEKKKRDVIRKDTLPAKMRELGLVTNDKGNFTTPYGTVYLETREFVGVPKDNEDGFANWLRNNGFEVQEFWEEKLNHAVLKGFIEERRAMHETIPEQITIHQEVTARIRKKK